MTTIPARSLSGDHLGHQIVYNDAANHRTIRGVLYGIEHDLMLARIHTHFTDAPDVTRVGSIEPDTPVTIEDTE